MSKLVRSSLILSGVILLGAGCARYREPTAPSSTTTPAPETSAPTPAISEAIIEYRNGVFNPSTLRVLAGTKVTFVNKGTKEIWPASGVHPAHQLCPGFDALKVLKNGETYSFVFTEVKDCPFHNHVAPAERGKIEVKAE